MSKIILSIIVPAYNVENYIENCIESCEKQDVPHENYEIIIVNDGSTDGTLEKIKFLANRFRNIKFINQHNQGLSLARNNGVKIACGKYIWFVDSDDEISANCFSSLISIMESELLDALVVAPQKTFMPNFPGEMKHNEYISDISTGSEFLLDVANFVVGAWCFIFSHSFWRNGNFAFKQGICYEDTELMPLVLSKISRLARISKFSCYNYIQHEGSIMNSGVTIDKIISLAVIVNSHLRYSKEMQSQELCLWFDRSASSAFIGGIKLIQQCDGDKKSLLQDFLEKIEVRPRTLYGKNLLQKLYQFIILKFPNLYLRIFSQDYGK